MFSPRRSLTSDQVQKRNSFEERKFWDKLRRIEFEERAFRKSHLYKINQNISNIRNYSNSNFLFERSRSELSTESNSTLKMEQGIKQLLLTNGEVDIEKVLCLHLLAIKQSEICTPKDESPRHIKVFTRYSSLLPNYIIETNESKIKCNCWTRENPKMKSDSRPIKMHLTMNKQIEKIIHIVIMTLKELNEKKLKLMISMAHNIKVLRTMLVRPTNQNFLSELFKSNLVLNSDESETECCTLIKGTNDMIRDINKYKKNMVFRINPPSSLLYLQAIINEKEVRSESLIDICKKISVGENLSGFAVLRNQPINSSGTAVISEDGKDIKYVKTNFKSKRSDLFENNLTLLLKSTFIDKDLKEESDKTIKSLDTESEKKESPDVLKANILRRMSNQQRIDLAKESARVKHLKKKKKNFLAQIMSNVMSKRSLLNLARNSTQEEREFFLKPVKNGGLGLGEVIIGKANMMKMEKIAAIAQGETITTITPLSEADPPPHKTLIDISTQNTWDLLKIKHVISNAEISKKCLKFLKSNSEDANTARIGSSQRGSARLTQVETRLMGRMPKNRNKDKILIMKQN